MPIPLLPRPKAPGPGPQGRLQEFIYQLDVGVGVKILKVFLFFLCVSFMMLLYTATQFTGLKEAEAMDMAQLGRNIAQGKGYTTNVIRPFSLWYMQHEHRERDPRVTTHPELFRPPVYPALLSIGFKLVRGDGEIDAVTGDKIVLVVSLLWILPSMAFLYLLARELFDRRVAVLSIWVYLLTNSVFAASISGTPLPFLTFLFLGAVYFLVRAGRRHESGVFAVGLTGFYLILSAAFLAVGTLTRYSFGLLLIPALVYIVLTFIPRRAAYLTLYLVVFLIPTGLWSLQQMRVSGKPLGLAPYAIVEGTNFFPKRALMRRYRDEVVRSDLNKTGFRMVAVKMFPNMEKAVENGFKNIGGNFIMVFFLAGLLHPFRRRDVTRVLRCGLVALALALLVCAATDAVAGGLMELFYPLAVIFGVAVFWIMFDRLALETRLKQAAVVLIFVAANALPLVLELLPPAARPPYPPLNSAWVVKFKDWYGPDEQIASDMPWAVAWYADRRSVWTPWTMQEFLAIHDTVAKMNGLYLTQLSLDDQEADAAFGEIQFTRRALPLDIQRPWAAMAMGVPLPALPAELIARQIRGFPLIQLNPFGFSNMLYTDLEHVRRIFPAPAATPEPPLLP